MRADSLRRGHPLDRLTGLIYWASLILLLSGMWILIDPYQRDTGQRGHVYITLIAFEIYVWLLLVLARWQCRHLFVSFSVRSAIFAVVLVGVMFIALNELHMAKNGEAYFLSPLLVLLSVAKLYAAGRWLGFKFPPGMVFYGIVWLVLLTLPANIIRVLASQDARQHLAAWGFCWAVALFIGLHISLAHWQRDRRWPRSANPFSNWWVGWIVLLILALMTIIQLYTTMWGMYIQWANWYFTPIYFALAMVFVVLSRTCQKHQAEAWIGLFLATIYAIMVHQERLPADFPAHAFTGLAAYLIDPYYAASGYLFAMLIVSGLLRRDIWLVTIGLAGPTLHTTWQFSRYLWNKQEGKGVALLIGAFALLGAGALIQWLQHRTTEEVSDLPELTE